MSDEQPTDAEIAAALDVIRRAGGVAGALLKITNQLRTDLRMLEARISDQDNRIAGLDRKPVFARKQGAS